MPDGKETTGAPRRVEKHTYLFPLKVTHSPFPIPHSRGLIWKAAVIQDTAWAFFNPLQIILLTPEC